MSIFVKQQQDTLWVYKAPGHIIGNVPHFHKVVRYQVNGNEILVEDIKGCTTIYEVSENDYINFKGTI